MKSWPERLLQWIMVLLAIVLFVFLARLISADKRGRSLHEAAWNNKMTKAKVLVWLGTDVNYRTGNGSALHGAAYNGNIEMMSFFIERGARVDLPAKFGETPLWYARKQHQIAAEEFLISHGANPDTSQISPP